MTKHFSLLILLSALLIFFHVMPPAHGFGREMGLSPFFDWKTLETENFRLTFPEELSPTAARAAVYFEEIHKNFKPIFQWQPRTKTQVVLVDNTDIANGLTSAQLRLGIILFVTPPEPYFATTYYDDWLKLVVLHEYVHLLNLDVTHDFWEVLRIVFGDAIRPNSFWPRWMLEGLAVYFESWLTSGGRGHSPGFEGILRAAVKENRLGSPDFASLDQLANSHPSFPSGTTPYLFGYYLMNQLSKESGASGDPYRLLGKLSDASGGKIPFFLNNQLEDLVRKDWYKIWNEWLASTEARMKIQIQKISADGVTTHKVLSLNHNQVYGVRQSPDGQWLAFSSDSPHEPPTLTVRNLKTNQDEWKFEKFFGSELSFTPDSKVLFYNQIDRRGGYATLSNVFGLKTDSGSIFALNTPLHSKDPDVSPDGKWIAFAMTQKQTTGILYAQLFRYEGIYKVRDIKKVYWPSHYSRCSQPHFSPDGKKLIFTCHENGKSAENLLETNLETNQTRILVQNGFYNRFPMFSPHDGKLYFISDMTGVDNLYRLESSSSGQITRITNVIGGLNAVAPGASPEIWYTSLTTSSGQVLAKITPHIKALSTYSILEKTDYIARTPWSIAGSEIKEKALESQVEGYSIFPSILPRQWAPLVLLQEKSVYLGGQILGFDATDRHRYLAYAAYDTEVKKADSFAIYQNRQLGPDIGVSWHQRTTSRSYNGKDLSSFRRKWRVESSIAHPFIFTYSTLTPVFSVGSERSYQYLAPLFKSEPFTAIVPTFDAELIWQNALSSAYAIAPEKGRVTKIGVRRYEEPDMPTYKGLLSDREFFKLFDHTTLELRAAGLVSSRVSSNVDSSANVVGRNHVIIGSSQELTDANLDDLGLRGYSGYLFRSRAATVGSAEAKIPLFQIFRGWGTRPIFFNQIYLFGFGDLAYFPKISSENPSGVRGKTLPSTGGGLRFNLELFYNLPLTLSVEFHQGLKKEFHGGSEFFVSIYGSLPTF